MVVLEEGEELDACPDCGAAVDSKVRSLAVLWPNGQPHLLRIILAASRDKEEAGGVCAVA